MKSKKITFFLIASALCISNLSLSAKDIFANATTGVDTNDGLTAETSVATVAQAYALASNADVIKLNGTFLFDAEIMMEKSITIQSADATKAILDGQGATRFFTLKNSITFINITFQNGLASEGGAFFIPIGYWRDMNFTDCVFDGNVANGQGGVFRMITYGGTDLLKINRCLFKNNHSGDHGGVFSYIPEGGDAVGNKATLTISNSTFINNKNNGGVGGILFVDGGAAQWGVFNFNNITVSGNSDLANTSGNIPGFAFVGSTMTVNVNNSVIEGNPSQNGDYADLSFGATPTALTIKNSIVGHVTVWGATVDPVNFTATESTVNSTKIAPDALVAGLEIFNGTYFPLTSSSLAYQYGKMSNLTNEFNADQLGHGRTNATLTSAGAVNYIDITSDNKNLNLNSNSNLLVGKNQITINAENSRVDVYNISGILVNSVIVDGTGTMKLRQGIYIVKISSLQGKTTSKVIIK